MHFIRRLEFTALIYSESQYILNLCILSVTNDVVNQARRVGVIRIGIVLMMSVAWFAIVNHCALTGLLAMQAKPAFSSCHHCAGDQSPAQNKNANDSECCKTLRATFVTAAKKLVGHDTSLFALQPYFVAQIIFPDDSEGGLPTLEFDTGPPFAASFAEFVLQRSILAHAPPALA
jgi:hypothetical protein